MNWPVITMQMLKQMTEVANTLRTTMTVMEIA